MSDFVPINGYETLYSINRNGEVMSNYYGIILKHGEAVGYPKVTLYKLGRKKPKTHHIHRLLAEHFIPNPKELPCVNHIFTVRAKQNWRGKITGYVISDGLNELHLSPYDFFVIDTDKPITEPLIRR